MSSVHIYASEKKINRPSWCLGSTSGDWFDLSYLSTSKASPNDSGIVIIIIVGEVDLIEHDVHYIAQTENREVPG
jgi:hypothetical protein